jgi:dTDP-4-amino-4,6-dideoxygalactose transaminase
MYKNESIKVEKHLPIAKKTAEQILCLPIYPELSPAEIQSIVSCMQT